MKRLVRRTGATIVLGMAMLAAGVAAGQEWREISGPITNEVQKEGWKVGFPGKGTAGVGVEPASGSLFVMVSDLGLWKSADQGATFQRVITQANGKPFRIGGRCETGGTFKLGWFGNYAWDPSHRVLYASRMGTPAYALTLEK